MTRCCLRPRGVSSALVFNALAAWPAPMMRGSALSQNPTFSGLCVSDSGLHPSPRHTRLSSFQAYAFSHYATERMTNPYSGGPVRYMRIPSQQATIARLPINSTLFIPPLCILKIIAKMRFNHICPKIPLRPGQRITTS